MQIKLNIWVVVFLVTLFQALFLSVSLWLLKPRKLVSKSLLVILLIVFCGILLEEFIQEAHLYGSFPHLIKFSTLLPFLFGPLLYLYHLFIDQKSPTKFTLSHWLHFTPFLLALLWHLPFYVSSGNHKLASFKMTNELIVWVYLKFIHIVIYIALIARRLQHLKVKNALTPSQRWFSWGFEVFAIGTIAVYLVFSLYWLPVSWWKYADQLGGMVIIVIVYAMSFVAIKNSGTLTKQTETKTKKEIRYATSTLKDTSKQAYLQQLTQLLESDQIYLNPNLTLTQLAEALSWRPQVLSQVINEMTGKSFYELMNQYRVDECKLRLKSPKHQHKTLLAIAFESGFNNKTTFNKTFKEATGMTPSAYRKINNESQTNH